MKLIKIFFLSLVAMFLIACGGEGSGLPSQNNGGPPKPGILSLQITPETPIIPAGFSQQYIAEALLDNGEVIDVTENPTVSWSSSDPRVATINNKGLATGLAAGTATITASGTSNGKLFSATAELTITSAVVTALQLTPALSSVPIGFEQQYTATAFLSDGTSLNVTNNAALSWSSSAPDIASISSGTVGKGLATGMAAGNATITASGSANGKSFSATADLTVTSAVVTALQLTPALSSVPIGLEQQYTATAFLSDGTSLNVTSNAALSWSSSDPAIATISSTGGKVLATGVAPGSVSITASGIANGESFSATADLTVTSAVVTALQLTPALSSVPIGFEQQYTATAFLSDGTSLNVTNNAALSWSSSAPDIASISSGTTGKGLATGMAAGNATITASGSANGKSFSATADLTVTSAVVTALQLTPALSSVPIGLEQQYTATAFLSDGTSLNVTNNAALSWISSDPAIATISSTGGKVLATGVAPGSVSITASGIAKGESFSATADLTVTGAVVTELQLTPKLASVEVGLEQQYTATAVLSDGTTRDVTNNAALSWISSDPAIATISSTGGKVLATGVAPGSVSITASGIAKGESFSATADLTVTGAVVTELQLTPKLASVEVGLEQQYTATAVLSDGTTRDVTNNAALSWSSSDPAIATISSTGGKVLATGVAPGSVSITASGIVNGTVFTATSKLDVIYLVLPIMFGDEVYPIGAGYSFHNWQEAYELCENLTYLGKEWHLPALNELTSLYAVHPDNTISSVGGWNTGKAYWASDSQYQGKHNTVRLDNGGTGGQGAIDTSLLSVACIHHPYDG
ncbi:Ig-like domain-containing protein [Aeromonas veronii]